MYLLAADIADSTIVTVSLPWAVWAALGGAVVACFAWLARLCLKALNESRQSSQSMHDEVVSLTREVVSSMTDNTAALREIAKSTEALTTLVLRDKGDDNEPKKD